MTNKKTQANESDDLNLNFKFINIQLSQITIEINNPAAMLQRDLQYLSGNYPIVQKYALPLLQLLQPIVVALIDDPDNNGKIKNYRLIAGFRTFQLCHEHFSGKQKCKVLCIDGILSEQIFELQLLDSIAIKLLQHPSEIDIGLIARAIKDEELIGKNVNRLLSIPNDQEMAKLFGVTKKTLYEKIKITKKWREEAKIAEGEKVKLK